ncbi:MAG: 4-oxalocrotonate tautomerase [Comamonadaceae bacterium]|nr:4-oxalocrotonate tautomerase [Comamonadaceae bacterium]
MPLAQICMLEGRTEGQKRAVSEKATPALHQTVGAPKETIRAWSHDVPRTRWGIAGVSAKDLEPDTQTQGNGCCRGRSLRPCSATTLS